MPLRPFPDSQARHLETRADVVELELLDSGLSAFAMERIGAAIGFNRKLVGKGKKTPGKYLNKKRGGLARIYSVAPLFSSSGALFLGHFLFHLHFCFFFFLFFFFAFFFFFFFCFLLFLNPCPLQESLTVKHSPTVGDDGARNLCRGLSLNQTLTKLVLDFCNIGEAGAEALGQVTQEFSFPFHPLVSFGGKRRQSAALLCYPSALSVCMLKKI
jgi:hypothetical protein